MSKFIRVNVFDKPGVLDQITGLIRRNSVNIRSITCGNVGGGISQITLALDEHARLDVLGAHIQELACVRNWEQCTPKTQVIRELLLVRFDADQKNLIEKDMRIIHEENGLTFVEYVADPASSAAMLEKLCAKNVVCALGGAVSIPLNQTERGEK
ncbi:MAG: ACT domain-containing protein [Deltaproteobacteria bacterium]|jgi:acetolactate synthase small subunit|nr:ACT domain-containing protein [Deltaproteobacteria bacterium]